MTYRIGCSGWSYPHWRDLFYPHGLRQADWFQHYASVFDTVEINNSFYRTPSEEVFKEWGRRAPAGFVYAVKVNRAVTQYYKLGPRAFPAFQQFVQRAEQMGTGLGPLLLQLPPSLGRDDERLDAFLAQPEVARHRVAIEFRRADWFAEGVYAVLRTRGVALVLSDLDDLPVPQVATAEWVYARFHGSGGKYWGSYSDDELRQWAERLMALCPDGYVYFNNDAGAAAVRNALRMREMLAAAMG